MRLGRFVLLFNFLAVGASLAVAQPADEIRERFELSLVNLDFNDLEGRLEKVIDPDLRAFYKQHAWFVKALASQTASDRDYFWELSTWAEAYLAQRRVSPLTDALLAEIFLERTIVEGLMRNYVSAANELRKCLKAYKAALRHNPNVALLRRINGLLLVGFSAVPKQYQWVTDLMGLEGDFSLGMRDLEYASQKGEVLRIETALMLYFIERNLMADENIAHARIDSLYNAHPFILGINYLYASNAFDRKENAEALATFQAFAGSGATVVSRLPLMHYAYGRSLLSNQQYGMAIQQFGLFLLHFKGQTYRQDAQFKLALANMLAGNDHAFRVNLAKVVELTASGFDEDAYAAETASQYLLNGVPRWDRVLLEARITYDGGYLARCQAYLDSAQAHLHELTGDQRTELYYRLGRLYQQRGDPTRAKAAYAQCVRQHAGRNLWMQPYAHFYTGWLFEREADWHSARHHFREALAYNDYHYQNGLEQRAKAGLSRLKNRFYDVPDAGETTY